MGKEVANVGGGHDFATGEFYIELHRRLVIPEEAFARVNEMLTNRQIRPAAEALKQVTPNDAHALIDVFFDSLGRSK